ncbi:MAG: DUF2909 domain-containing protein [Sinobacterium sp.]|nr:DUF2909 domain-containing protein [Sinobacterium sp.]
MIKLSILITFILLTISLFSGLFIVYKDKGEGNRGLYALIIRVSLAVLLMLQVIWGIATGQIGSRAPWDRFDAPHSPPLRKSTFQSKAPILHDPIKDSAIKEAREAYLRSNEAYKLEQKNN